MTHTRPGCTDSCAEWLKRGVSVVFLVRAAAAVSMAASRRRRFRDVLRRFMEFFKAVYNFNIQCKH